MRMAPARAPSQLTAPCGMRILPSRSTQPVGASRLAAHLQPTPPIDTHLLTNRDPARILRQRRAPSSPAVTITRTATDPAHLRYGTGGAHEAKRQGAGAERRAPGRSARPEAGASGARVRGIRNIRTGKPGPKHRDETQESERRSRQIIRTEQQGLLGPGRQGRCRNSRVGTSEHRSCQNIRLRSATITSAVAAELPKPQILEPRAPACPRRSAEISEIALNALLPP